MFKIIILILIVVLSYKVYHKWKVKQRKIIKNKTSKLGVKDFSGISNKPLWWQFIKNKNRKKEIYKSKMIFMNTLRKDLRRR